MAVAVVEESDRLVGMINTMLELAHTESGIADFSMEPVDVGQVLRDAYELFQPVAEDEGIRFEIDLPQEALIVSGDVTRLQRVLANLLDNAIKYTEAGGRVRLEAKRNKPDVTVSVIDSGIGISGADLPHIFERFYRHDRSRSTPGSGLGLTLALAFARAHGGDITVTSAPGEGATFTVTLPRRAVPS
jgi:signal transduction histidine kinase